jgi:hypothetical protein
MVRECECSVFLVGFSPTNKYISDIPYDEPVDALVM